MTRQEIADLLELIIANYPKTFIKDRVGALIALWEMAFGDEPADRVYRAVRHHMDVSTEFPTIAHVRDSMNKGEMIYGNSGKINPQKIAPPVAPHKKIMPKTSCNGCILADDICEGMEDGKCPWDGI